MKRFLILLVMLAGCSGMRHTSSVRVVKDSTFNGSHRLDSVFMSFLRRDSVYIHDSIYVREKGDTVTKYVERVRYRYKLLTDTVYRDKILTDTLFITRIDSVKIEKPVFISKSRCWYSQILIWLIILGGLFLHMRKKITKFFW